MDPQRIGKSIERRAQQLSQLDSTSIQNEFRTALGNDPRVNPSLLQAAAFMWIEYGRAEPQIRLELMKLKTHIAGGESADGRPIGRPWSYLKAGLTRICRQFGVEYPQTQRGRGRSSQRKSS